MVGWGRYDVSLWEARRSLRRAIHQDKIKNRSPEDRVKSRQDWDNEVKVNAVKIPLRLALPLRVALLRNKPYLRDVVTVRTVATFEHRTGIVTSANEPKKIVLKSDD